eukprot:m.2945 g.2945  ORF g.2945 m.2945 type:complete len:924 (+) comp1982_c0_seq1:38-2809(+)
MTEESRNTLETALAAIHSLYFDQDAERKTQANVWLTSFIEEEGEWEVAWELLDDHRPMEARFYGITVMAYKISKQWGGLTTEVRQSLCSSLLEKTVGSYSSNAALFNKFSSVLSILLIKGVPEVMEQFEECIFDKFKMINSDDEDVSADIATLKFFTVLGEELKDRFISARRKKDVDVEFGRAKENLITWCLSLLANTQSEEMVAAVLQCAAAWTFCYQNFETSLQLCASAFPYLEYSELCPAACKLVSETFCLDSSFSPDSSQDMIQLATQILQTKDIFDAAVNDWNDALMAPLVHLVVEFGQQHMRFLTMNPSLLDGFLRYMFTITSIPGNVPIEDSLTVITYDFWYQFVDYITDLDSETCNRMKDLYNGMLMELIEVIANKSRYLQAFDDDELSEFINYRNTMGDLVSYICMFLKDDALSFLANLLETAIKSGNEEDAESFVFYFGQAAESLERHQQTPNAFINMICGFSNQAFFHLNQTAVVALGNCADWLQNNPARLEEVILFLSLRIQDVSLTEVVAGSFKAITKSCDSVLASFVDDLLRISLPVLSSDASFKVRRYFTEGLCWVLSKCETAIITQALPNIYSPIFVEFSRCVRNPSEDAATVISENLSIFARAIYCLSPDIPASAIHPVFTLVQELIGHFGFILDNFGWSEDVLNKMCICLTHSFQTLDNQIEPLLSTIIAFAVNGFESTQQAAFINILSDVMTFSHNNSELAEQLCSVFYNLFCKISSLVTTAQEDEDATVDPMVLSRFFHLVYRVGRSSHEVLLHQESETLQQLLSFIIQGTTFQEMEVVKEATGTLGMLIEKWKHPEEVDAIIVGMLEEMVSMYVTAIAEGAAPRLVAFYSDVLHKIFKRDDTAFMTTLVQVLNELESCDDEIKNTLVQGINGRIHILKSAFQRCFSEFRTSCFGSKEVIVVD